MFVQKEPSCCLLSCLGEAISKTVLQVKLCNLERKVTLQSDSFIRILARGASASVGEEKLQQEQDRCLQ